MVRRQRKWAGVSLCWLVGALAAQDRPVAQEARLTGSVVDEDGRPVAGAAVGVFEPDVFVDTARLLAKPPTSTDQDGRYSIAVGPRFQQGVLVIAAAGRQSGSFPIDENRARSGGAIADAVLPPGARLSGRVRDEQGAGLAGVRVRVENGFSDRSGAAGRLSSGAVSDAQGIFTVPCVPRTGMRLSAQADGYLATSLLVGQQSPIDLTLSKIGRVHGKVVDAGGGPIAGVPVYAVTVEHREDFETVRSAADGSFALTVPVRGRFRIAGDERVAPHRQFSSDLLHGAADGVVLREWRTPEAQQGWATLTVVVVDAVTHAPIDDFQLSEQNLDLQNVQLMLFHHGAARRAYHGMAAVELHRQAGQPHAIVVDAAGHGFEVCAVPGDLGQVLEVALGPEAVLTGQVIDAGTGKPMAGVAVRALPKGNSYGGGGRLEDIGCFSDADGRFRIERLRPGEFGVQVHAEGRPASRPVAVTLQSGSDNRVELRVPEQRWLEFQVEGHAPPGPPRSLHVTGYMSSSAALGFFQHYVPTKPLALTGPGPAQLGPLSGEESFMVQVFVPSRTRVGVGTAIDLGVLTPGRDVKELRLEDYAVQRVTGRVALPVDVPTERIAVLAKRVKGTEEMGKGMAHVASEGQPSITAVDGDGGFVFDLPTGSYCLQVADLLTGIIFHTDSTFLDVSRAATVTVKPAVHWLAIECVPEHAGDEVVLHSFGVQLARDRGTFPAFLTSWSRSNGTEQGAVAFRPGAARQRWLVPAGAMRLEARQTFEILQPWSRGWQAKVVAAADLIIDKPEQAVTFTIPAPPSDEQLLERK